MTPPADTPPPATRLSGEQIRALHEARARAEIAAADALVPGSDRVAWCGTLLCEVALVKGSPGPAEVAGGPALSGSDGIALAKALVALGWPEDAWFATLSRPEPDADAESRSSRIRLQLEAVDPRMIVALDAQAAEDVARAFGLTHLRVGEAIQSFGRRIVALEGFEASLGDERRKRRVWQQLQAVKPEGPVY